MGFGAGVEAWGLHQWTSCRFALLEALGHLSVSSSPLQLPNPAPLKVVCVFFLPSLHWCPTHFERCRVRYLTCNDVLLPPVLNSGQGWSSALVESKKRWGTPLSYPNFAVPNGVPIKVFF